MAKRILIVEDDVTFGTMLNTWFAKNSWDAKWVSKIELAKLEFQNSSFDLVNKTNTNSYSYVANELCITTNENNIQYNGNDSNYGVEMSHFNIVQIIQKNKSMLVKNE